jgi:2-polyprenyl-3-methyl-5-hydroxy-6-metoxy-1,4-benzoquinol methylase
MPNYKLQDQYFFLKDYWENAFDNKNHLKDFLELDSDVFEQKISECNQIMKKLGEKFEAEKTNIFWEKTIGYNYLFELVEWHLKDQEYIGSTLCLIAKFAQGKFLDFGGGIGTHTIAAALCPQITQVFYWDINPIHREFVQYRINKLGLTNKIFVLDKLDTTNHFDTILCVDVLEHLQNPSQQLLDFYSLLDVNGILIANWDFFKGFSGEFPFYLDEPKTVKEFFKTLQKNFLEFYHPYFQTTARCYHKWIESSYE